MRQVGISNPKGWIRVVCRGVIAFPFGHQVVDSYPVQGVSRIAPNSFPDNFEMPLVLMTLLGPSVPCSTLLAFMDVEVAFLFCGLLVVQPTTSLLTVLRDLIIWRILPGAFRGGASEVEVIFGSRVQDLQVNKIVSF